MGSVLGHRRFQKWFDADVLGFQMKLWRKYFGFFDTFCQKLGEILFNFLVTLEIFKF
jgi:hypothetical protein